MAAVTAFTQWFTSFCKTFLSWLYNHGIDLLQHMSDGLVDFIISVVTLFPSGSTVPALGSAPVGESATQFFHTLNWLFPVSFFVSCVSFIAAGMLAYVVIMPIARWAKLLN
jgi:hypothetical protein